MRKQPEAKLNCGGKKRMKIVLIKFILQGKINVKKRELYYEARHLSLTNPRVVTCSQELDSLLNNYQEILIFQDKCNTSYNLIFNLAFYFSSQTQKMFERPCPFVRS